VRHNHTARNPAGRLWPILASLLHTRRIPRRRPRALHQSSTRRRLHRRHHVLLPPLHRRRRPSSRQPTDEPPHRTLHPAQRPLVLHSRAQQYRCSPLSSDYRCLTCYWISRSHIYSKTSTILTELVPITYFVFRYDRGVLWMAAHGWAPNLWNSFTHYVFDAMWRTRFQYRVVHLVGGTPHIFQGLAIPEPNASSLLGFLEGEFKIYPLWLCPIKHDSKTPMHTALASPLPAPSSLINISVWSSPEYGTEFLTPDTFDRFVSNDRGIEHKVAKAGGLKWLYASNYYSEEDFWEVYDKGCYEKLRAKWKAERLPGLWGKVRRTRQDLKGVTGWIDFD
jgi:hypothetical protein